MLRAPRGGGCGEAAASQSPSGPLLPAAPPLLAGPEGCTRPGRGQGLLPGACPGAARRPSEVQGAHDGEARVLAVAAAVVVGAGARVAGGGGGWAGQRVGEH